MDLQTQAENNAERAENILKHSHTVDTVNDCYGLTKACWLACLTFTLLVIELLVGVLKEMAINDSFWKMSNAIVNAINNETTMQGEE